MVSKFIKCIGQELNKRWASIVHHIAYTGFQNWTQLSDWISQFANQWFTIRINLKSQADWCLQYKQGRIDLLEVFSMEFDCHKNIDMRILSIESNLVIWGQTRSNMNILADIVPVRDSSTKTDWDQNRPKNRTGTDQNQVILKSSHRTRAKKFLKISGPLGPVRDSLILTEA